MIFGLLLITVLLGLAGYFSWRQWQTRKRVRNDPEMNPLERQYLLAQVWRRWIGCGLMVIFACCLAGTGFLEGRYQQLVNTSNQSKEDTETKEPKEEDKHFARFFTCYWVFTLLVFLMLIAVAGFDARAVLKEGVRKHRELRDSEKAMLEEEIRNFRRDTNGHF